MNGVPITSWSGTYPCASPEQRMARFIADNGGEDAYDTLAAQRAYRQAIEQALPSGFRLAPGNVFYGPTDGTQNVDGVWQTPSFHSLFDLHEAVIDAAVDGPAEGYPDDDYRGHGYLRRIAEPFRITENTTSILYATWQEIGGERSVETTVGAALSFFGRRHVEQLADSGRYDLETLGRAVSGGFGTADRSRDVAAAYREAINEALPDGFALKDDDFYGPRPRRDIDLKGAVKSVNLEQIIIRCAVGELRELWSAEQVAEEFGFASAASARRALSRWGVRATKYQETDSGRVQALYDAAQVRAKHASRPGRGHRSDLQA
ncbi:hypothetical protein ACFV4E_15325 [Streptomyces hygroscopicus]|uniref:Uncharacterized protein n=1 Tax=Streptomyces demainii TaxID=588122 RepID=A0ABT9KHK5_9ACTN|nr:hypothetical protein [Streptomyces demainii]MDP9607891.1 hypothetical protein [Streptomyces demainii]